MIKVINACTCELDNHEQAVQDILNQIDIKNGLLKNSVALLFCHLKFIETGIMEAVRKSLPFDVLGCTSMYFAMDAPEKMAAQSGAIMLTVTVLTSDDTEFATGMCDPLTPENADDRIHTLYRETAASLGGKPDLVFALLPTMFELTMDVMTASLYSACGGVPVFGTLALDLDLHIRTPKTMYQGTAYNDRMALLLFKGPVNPRFFHLCFPEKSVLDQDAVVTEANGSELISINNQPAQSFLQEIGLIRNSEHTDAIPLILHSSDGSKTEVVIVQGINDEGVLLCSRRISAGSILNIGAITADYVLDSARTFIQRVKEGYKDGAGLFILSCVLRAVVLGESAAAEVKLIQQELDNFPCTHLYLHSGGELCPKYGKSGEIVNQSFHYAIIACLI